MHGTLPKPGPMVLQQKFTHVVARPPVLARLQLHPTDRSARFMRLEYALGKTHRGWWWPGAGYPSGQRCHK